MTFSVPYAQQAAPRLQSMEPNGTEQRVQGPDPMDMSYMKLLDSVGAKCSADLPATVEEAPDPVQVVKMFEEARSNLDIIVDMVTNLQNGYIEAKALSSGRRPGMTREDRLFSNLLERTAGTHSSLGRVAQRLQQGAAALKAKVDREDLFYRQLAQLQRFWKIHLNPKVIDCPFIVDLSLPEYGSGAAAAAAGGAAGQASASDGAALPSQPSITTSIMGNTYNMGSRSTQVPLLKGEDGSLRVQVELPKDRPSALDPPDKEEASVHVVAGARRVHSLLLLIHRRQLWQHVCAGLERDATAPGTTTVSAHNVLFTLAKLAAQRIEHSDDPCLAALRPLMLEHLLACRLPQQTKPPPPRPHVRLLSSVPLLPDVAALLNQIVFREHQRHHLDLEARTLPFVRLHWRPCSNMLMSAMDVYIGPQHRILLVIRDGQTHIEGVVHRTGRQAGCGAGASRWVRDTHMGFSRHDVPCVLRSILQTLGFPWEPLLGLQPWDTQAQAGTAAPGGPAAAPAAGAPVAAHRPQAASGGAPAANCKPPDAMQVA